MCSSPGKCDECMKSFKLSNDGTSCMSEVESSQPIIISKC